eukprot:maker-scaffold_6-snap-gene-11.65-mRNA-1 protein AED:0.21 eAED:0.21 QI:116/1/1/1/1/1/2/110/306
MGEPSSEPLSSLTDIVLYHKLDYLTVLFLYLVTAILLHLSNTLTFNRFFLAGEKYGDTKLVDASLSFPFKENETFPDINLVVIVTLIYIVTALQTFYSYSPNISLTYKTPNFSLYTLHAIALMFFQTVALSGFIAQCCKQYAGRLRPDFIARLATKDPKVIQDGKFSYISGHSTFAFATMTLLGLFLVGQNHVFAADRKQKGASFHKLVVYLFLPLLFAGMVAISRTRDYYHDYSDINAGSAVGIFCAVCVYFLHFPSVSDKDSHIPKVLLQQLLNHKRRSFSQSSSVVNDVIDENEPLVYGTDKK